MLLSRDELVARTKSYPPLVVGMIDPEIQIQPSGIELTLHQVHTLEGRGSVDFNNTERKLPEGRPLEFNENGWLDLGPGCYRILYNEVVNIPLDLTAIARPRSSIIRCGANIHTAVWDPGYTGRSESLLVVHNPHGFRLKQDARLIQLLFLRIKPVEKGYNGVYQHENIS